MTVSTATSVWKTGILVMASGTIAEVIAEMAAGTASTYPLLSREYFMSCGGTTAGNCVVLWYYP